MRLGRLNSFPYVHLSLHLRNRSRRAPATSSTIADMAVSDTAAMLLAAVYILQGFLDSLPR